MILAVVLELKWYVAQFYTNLEMSQQEQSCRNQNFSAISMFSSKYFGFMKPV